MKIYLIKLHGNRTNEFKQFNAIEFIIKVSRSYKCNNDEETKVNGKTKEDHVLFKMNSSRKMSNILLNTKE